MEKNMEPRLMGYIGFRVPCLAFSEMYGFPACPLYYPQVSLALSRPIQDQLRIRNQVAISMGGMVRSSIAFSIVWGGNDLFSRHGELELGVLQV